MELSFDNVLIVIGIIALLVVLIFIWRGQMETLLKKDLVISLILLSSYKNLELFLHPSVMLSPYGIFDMWFRHFFFYLGQAYIFIFITHLFYLITKREGLELSLNNFKVSYKNIVIGSFTLFFVFFIIIYQSLKISEIPPTLYNVTYFITERGITHIMALIFFFLTIAVIRTYSLHSSYKIVSNFLKWFFVANSFFIFLHVFEYLKETLGFFPSITDRAGENIEIFFQYTAFIIFVISIIILFKIEKTPKLSKKNV